MNKNLLKAAQLCIFLSTGAAALGQCAAEANVYAFEHGGKAYEIVKEGKSWTAAAACAVERGGMLAEIDNEAENTAVAEGVMDAGINPAETRAPDGKGSYVWLGGNDLQQESKWVWNGDNNGTSTHFFQGTIFQGEPIDGLYNNWGNEPDNAGGNQDALGMSVDGWPLGTAGEWNDVRPENLLYFVVEKTGNMGISESAADAVQLYPNPARNELHLSGLKGSSPYTILDTTGKVISQGTAENAKSIDISSLSPGAYLIKVNGTVLKFICK